MSFTGRSTAPAQLIDRLLDQWLTEPYPPFDLFRQYLETLLPEQARLPLPGWQHGRRHGEVIARMQGYRLADDRDLALEPGHLANYPDQSLINEPLDGWCRIQESFKRRLDDHALAESRAFGRNFKPLKHALGELNGDLLGSLSFVRARLRIAVGLIHDRAGLASRLSIDLHFCHSPIGDRDLPAHPGTRGVDFGIETAESPPAMMDLTQGPIGTSLQPHRHLCRSLA
ncbi:hypothetical protein ABIB85_007561 [Bradyrhizobium sp. JR1.5]|uniref:hypothetical protein n=1 Tax=unclassified Bradyrhizobium TaxID=2631580 RepID=UPI003396B135